MGHVTKAQFRNRFRGELLRDDKDEWSLTDVLVFDSVVLDRTVIVPSGFITDFASVPRIPIAYMLVGGKAKRAAVIHDYLYRVGLVGYEGDCVRVTREQADDVFLEAMKATAQREWQRKLMWLGVRLGGRRHYKPQQSCAVPIDDTKGEVQ